uniref:NADH dehydrogenase subunit 2 n=1 Tax=Zanna robusticephalica TaxID=3081104 RepID=UPI002A836307|nr:NADH dehydrogenase subunit 2 [Zanna robusticephalica]WOW98853.1 NADH dehydrogenase subunit 2 [Zanna robusticephalica]
MKMNYTKFSLLTTMMLSILWCCSSNNLLSTWISMEINLICFLPMMKKSKKMNEQLMKYLIIQSVSSSTMLMSMMISTMMETTIKESILMTTSMLTKMGMMPFHLWMPNIMQMLSWNMCIMMNTIQKIIPTIMISQCSSLKIMILPMIMSMIFSPIVGMKQTTTKKLMAYSSISNSPLLILALNNSTKQFLLLFLIYSTMNITMMMIFKKNNINSINQMYQKSKLTKLSILLTSLSMSGMPPTSGFMIKWMIIQSTMNFSISMVITIIMSSILSTYMYINMMIPSMMKSMKQKQKTNKNYSFLVLSMSLNLIMIPVMTLTTMN